MAETRKEKKERVSQVIRSMFTLRQDTASFEEIENTIVSGSKLQGTNACILMLAILVACVGLNTNSTAVIIGAMLISPLMGGLTAIAYGFATNNLTLAKFSAVRLLAQVVISVVTSFVYFSISPITTASGELLARTSPTVWDVLIATGGGFAGIIGQTRKEKSNVIPGVAIATALMPPLCTAGYGLARHNMRYFGGAMYLFFINGFFITVTAIIVLKFLRVPQFTQLSRKQLNRIHRNITIIAVITMIPSVFLAYNTVKDTIANSNIDSFIKNEFVFSGTQVVQKNVDIDDKHIEVSLIGTTIDEQTRRELKEKLADYSLDGYELTITQTPVKGGITADEVKTLLEEYEDSESKEQVDVEGLLSARENQELEEDNEKLREENEGLKAQLEEHEKLKIDVSRLSDELMAIQPKIKGAAASRMDVNTSTVTKNEIVVTLLVEKALEDEELATIKTWLGKRLDSDNVIVFQQKIKTYTTQG